MHPIVKSARLRKLGAILAFLAYSSPLASSARAGGIAVSGADLVGFRSTTNGVLAHNSWTNGAGGFRIAWNIFFDPGSNLWNYSYTLTRLNGQVLSGPDLSHWILELSSDVTAADLGMVFSNANFSLSGVVGPQVWGPAPGNPNMLTNFYGVKFDFGQSNITFQSVRSPIWGDFYAKGGSSSAQNLGIGTDPTGATTDFTNWVPTPNTAIPEPGTWMLVAGGMLGLLWLKKLRGDSAPRAVNNSAMRGAFAHDHGRRNGRGRRHARPLYAQSR